MIRYKIDICQVRKLFLIAALQLWRLAGASRVFKQANPVALILDGVQNIYLVQKTKILTNLCVKFNKSSKIAIENVNTNNKCTLSELKVNYVEYENNAQSLRF